VCFPESLPSLPSLAEIEELLRDAGLEHYWEPASAWCIEEGARFVDEIAENKDEFAEALALKRFEEIRLERALARAAAFHPASPIPGALPVLSARPLGGHVVRVRNTFLNLDDPQRIDLPRARTAPAGQEHQDDSDSEEERRDAGSKEDPEEVDVLQTGSPRGLADLAPMMTFDDYGSASAWGWLGSGGNIQGDPNFPRTDEWQTRSAEPGSAIYAVAVMPVVEVNPCIHWAYEPITSPAPLPDLALSAMSSGYRIRWTVDSRKLKSLDREAASPIFELSFGGPVKFKMILKPRAVHDAKGGASFKKAQGWGSIDLKCLCDVKDLTYPTVSFRLGVGNHSNPKKQQRYRGPVRHDFRERPICGLKGREVWWDFQRSVDKQTHTFVVCLEIFPSSS